MRPAALRRRAVGAGGGGARARGRGAHRRRAGEVGAAARDARGAARAHRHAVRRPPRAGQGRVPCHLLEGPGPRRASVPSQRRTQARERPATVREWACEGRSACAQTGAAAVLPPAHTVCPVSAACVHARGATPPILGRCQIRPLFAAACYAAKPRAPVRRAAEALARMADSSRTWQDVRGIAEREMRAAGAGPDAPLGRFLALGERIVRLNALLQCAPGIPPRAPAAARALLVARGEGAGRAAGARCGVCTWGAFPLVLGLKLKCSCHGDEGPALICADQRGRAILYAGWRTAAISRDRQPGAEPLCGAQALAADVRVRAGLAAQRGQRRARGRARWRARAAARAGAARGRRLRVRLRDGRRRRAGRDAAQPLAAPPARLTPQEQQPVRPFGTPVRGGRMRSPSVVSVSFIANVQHTVCKRPCPTLLQTGWRALGA